MQNKLSKQSPFFVRNTKMNSFSAQNKDNSCGTYDLNEKKVRDISYIYQAECARLLLGPEIRFRITNY